MIINVTTETEFNQHTEEGVCVVDFWAEWCGPCRMLSSVIQEIDNEDLKILKINVDNSQELASTFNVQSIPHLILFKDGKVFDQKTGFMPKSSLLKWIESANSAI